MDALRALCCTYKAARQDAAWGRLWQETAHTGSVMQEEGVPDVAASTASKHSPHAPVGTVMPPMPPTGSPARLGQPSAMAAKGRSTLRGAAGAQNVPAPRHLPMMFWVL